VKIQRAYKTELDPNETQRKLFRGYSGAVRFVYNWMLARRDEHLTCVSRKSIIEILEDAGSVLL